MKIGVKSENMNLITRAPLNADLFLFYSTVYQATFLSSFWMFQEKTDVEKSKLRDNQTEDQINRNAAEYYHKQKDLDEMKKSLNRIRDIPYRVMFLKNRFDGENDYIKLAASFYLENGNIKFRFLKQPIVEHSSFVKPFITVFQKLTCVDKSLLLLS